MTRQLTFRDGVPRLIISSAASACPPSAETGDGRPLDKGRLAFASWASSSSGSTASLEGTGVKVEPEAVLDDLTRILDGAGVDAGAAERGVGAAGELVEGVFWKKPKRVFCPPDDDDLLRAGVAAGVEAAFRGILTSFRSRFKT